MPTTPTLVFVPGAWHKPSCYDKVIAILQESYGLKCTAITLPSTLDNPSATFKDDLDVAREAISTEINEGRDVVLIAHSYGGMVANSAIKGFARPSNTVTSEATPSTGHVIGLILIASGFTLTGMAFMDPFLGYPPPAWRVNKTTGYAEIVVNPRQFFYHDVPTEEAEYRVSQLTTQSLKSLFEGAEHAYAGWRDVPAWYIGTIEDQGLPVVAQRINVGFAREMGTHVEHRELQTSHSPFLSRPKETASLLREAVEAFAGVAIQTATEAVIPAGIVLPSPRLWQPSSWFRYGLPLVFGRLFGRGYLVFSWVRGCFARK
ncbi:alpha/beta-hydrolase [Sarocladium strictum]